jgi:3-deoxy-manno-octulosonate cytidylyltransferase (CMP-KDO synthetase)
MKKDISIGVIIPARMESVRLPGKPLLRIFGTSMIEHVRRRAMLSELSENIIVTSGNLEILNEVNSNGGKTFKSNLDHVNGLSRVAEAALHYPFTHIVVLQGDEILVTPQQINRLRSAIFSKPHVDFWNGICNLESSAELKDPSVVKCILKKDESVQTIFRQVPLVSSTEIQMKLVKKICGLFAITSSLLREIVLIEPTPVEQMESIEQMRLLETSIDISTFDMQRNYPSINLPTDVDKVKHILSTDPVQKRILEQITSNA